MLFLGEKTPGFGRGFLFVGLFAYRERCVLPFRIRDVDHHPADHQNHGAFGNRLIHSLRMQEQRRARHANGKAAWRQRLAAAARRQLICLIGRFFLFP